MGYLIGLAQSGFPEDGDVLAQARAIAGAAASRGCRLVVFPEDFMWPRKLTAAELSQIAEPLDGPFVRSIAAIMRERGQWAVFTVNERNPRDARPFNTAVVVDDAGAVRACYRKCHLYDALGVKESSRLSAGAGLPAPVEAPFATIGLQICYDLRFPEPARALALGGCDLLVYPAAWHAGDCKAAQWETLLRARAIENELYVAGVCRAGAGYSGASMVVDSMGRVVARADAAREGTGPGAPEGLLVCEVDPGLVGATRERMPVFAHRRPGLYAALAQ